MTIESEKEASILRYHYVEKWPVGTIARELGVHHSCVTRVLAQAGIQSAGIPKRGSLLDPFLPFILETLKKHPKLKASRLYGMVKERGYTGGPDHFRHFISFHRPKRAAEAYLRLRTLPGEQGQVDWAHFDYITVGRAKRPLMAFVMVLSFSRTIFLRFYLNAQQANFLRGHEAAFNAWGGLPRVLLYDNLRSAVLERRHDAIRFNPELLAFAAHYRFEPRPVAVARGNEKGRVERAIRYVRDNFFAARTWTSLDELNQQADEWCHGYAADRPCPENTAITVREAFLQEQPSLLALPHNPYPTHDYLNVKVGKTPYVRFDLNDYSIPPTQVCRILTVAATSDTVSILEGSTILAEHPRTYDKGQQIEREDHLNSLRERKREARHHHGQDRLLKAVPTSALLLAKAAERNYSLKRIVHQLIDLLEGYGATELEIAIQHALARDVPHPNAIRLCLEKRREQRREPPPINLGVSQDKRAREVVIKAHSLHQYDSLQEN